MFCLPVIETLGNDLSAFVATNVISITDGQLYLDSTLFGLGVFPAVSIQKSVSRVGAKALDPFWRKVSFLLSRSMNEYKQELESVVKSKMFVVQQHRWQRIYKLFHQRSPWSHFVKVQANAHASARFAVKAQWNVKSAEAFGAKRRPASDAVSRSYQAVESISHRSAG